MELRRLRYLCGHLRTPLGLPLGRASAHLTAALARQSSGGGRSKIVFPDRHQRKTVFARGLGISSVYLTGTLILSYATSQLGIDRQTMLNLLLTNAVVQFL
jgi:hypothetical protein